MHELALGQAIVDSVNRRAEGREIHQVVVRIGHLRQVVPDSLQFAWEMLTQGSDLDRTRLEIDHVPAVIVCRECGETTILSWPILLCASCDSIDVELVSGEEFLIATMDLRDADPATPEANKAKPMGAVT